MISWLSQLNANDEFELSDLSKAFLICWKVCNDRNNLVFRNCKAHPAKVPMVAPTVDRGYNHDNENLRSIHTQSETYGSSQTNKWRPPHAPKLKLILMALWWVFRLLLDFSYEIVIVHLLWLVPVILEKVLFQLLKLLLFVILLNLQRSKVLRGVC